MNSIRFRYREEFHYIYVDINEANHTLYVEIVPKLKDSILAGELERILSESLQSMLNTWISAHTAYDAIEAMRMRLDEEMKSNTYLRNAIMIY